MKIFHNAKIYTPKLSSATAVVIDHGHFIALGSDADILNGPFKTDQVINMQKKTFIPGLTDAHVHLRHLAESMAMVNCETDTLEECLSRIKSAADNLPQGSWLRGHGWNQNQWDSGFGTAEMLDAVCHEHPVYLTAKSLHAAWANSKALALAGINTQTPQPTSGTIQKDSSGQPTGILFESGAMTLVESIIPKPSKEALKKKILDLFPELWKLGLVGVHDFDGFDCWVALQELHQQGNMRLRVRKNIPFIHMDKLMTAGLHTDYGDDWLHLGGVKLFSDGALGPQTAAMQQPYEHTNECGVLLLDEEEILNIGQQAVNHGLSLSIHAIGDKANHVVLNAFTKLRDYEKAHNHPQFRHRIEHVQIIDQDDLRRLASLGIVASIQPVHCPSDMNMAEKYLGSRTRNAYAYRNMIESGADVVLGSDAPVEPINPFLGIHAAVTRRRSDGAPGPDGWHPEQRLSLDQAIEGFSHTPAKIANRGSRLGMIAPGYKADFLILSEDPFQLDPQDLWKIKPAATFIEGECVYQSSSISFKLSNS